MSQNLDSSSDHVLSVRSIVGQAFLWLVIPVVIFLLGWFIWWIALPATILLIAALYRILRFFNVDSIGLKSVKITPSYWWSIAGIILLLLLCGHGGIFYQQWDWQFRNAIFFDLARRPWPVTYDAGTPELLCYYFAFFLPGALISKWTGLILPGDIVQFVYAAWGISIAYSLVCSFLGGRSRWWILPLMVLFAGADTAVSSLLVSFTQVGEWWPDRWLIFDYYKSFSLFEQLSLIFNQAIPCWIALPLIYAWRKSPGRMLLVCSLLFVFAPLPCVGIILPVAFFCITNLKKLLTLPTFVAIVITVLTGLFFLSNSNGSEPGLVSTLAPGKVMTLSLIFLFFGVGIWLPIIWNKVKNNPAFWLLLFSAWVLPFISIGNSSDLGTRAAIPLMIFIFYTVVKSISNAGLRSRRAWMGYFIFAVAVSSFGAIMSLATSLDGYKIRPGKRFEMVGHLNDHDYNICYNNFIAVGSSLYSRFLSPPLVEDSSEVIIYEIESDLNDSNCVEE